MNTQHCESVEEPPTPEEITKIFLDKLHRRPIGGKYKLIQRLAQGGHGVVYFARDIAANEDVVLKLEHDDNECILIEEAKHYRELQGLVGFPKVLWHGDHDEFRVLALELLGPSLDDLVTWCDNRFSLKTTLMIADQMLTRLEALHSTGIVHLDVKPSNIMIGSGGNSNTIYLTDFGISEEYRYSRNMTEEEANETPHLMGSLWFASIQAHYGLPRRQFPKEDLESLGYMLVFLLKGRLPWQNDAEPEDKEAERREVMEMKMSMSAQELCAGLPAEFVQYMEYVKSLTDQDWADYEWCRQNFRLLAEDQGLEYDNVFDWTVRVYLQAKEAEAEAEAGE